MVDEDGYEYWTSSDDDNDIDSEEEEEGLDPETTSTTSKSTMESGSSSSAAANPGAATAAASPQSQAQPTHVEPVLYQWLVKTRAQVLSKFTFYFHDYLKSTFATAEEFKKDTKKRTINFPERFHDFLTAKQNFYSMVLIFDASKELQFYGPGYHMPGEGNEPGKQLHQEVERVEPVNFFILATGLGLFPICYSWPIESEINMEVWRHLVLSIQDHNDELKTNNRVIFFSDRRVSKVKFKTIPCFNQLALCFQTGLSLHMLKIEMKMTLVAMSSVKHEKDPAVANFMKDMSSMLRGYRVFASIRPNFKG